MLEVRRATHRYGSEAVLRDVSLDAAQGEFLTLLGESGSGKTTLLRIIAGLVTPTAIESLRIGGCDVRSVPTAERNCTTVFQHYALFPHMSVGENVEYGLRTRGVPRDERRRSALAGLDLVRLSGFQDRRINQLSGGERQRVALARALVTRPDVLLLDEPLGALDEKLRQDMQGELTEIHRELGLTFVYVTHSQEEAVTMSNRIALFRKGRIAQCGSPRDLFERPRSRFVARFMGIDNILDGVIEAVRGDEVAVRIGARTVAGPWRGAAPAAPGAAASVAVRAESVRLMSGSDGADGFACRLRSQVYKGRHVELVFESDLGPLRARADVNQPVPDTGVVGWAPAACSIVPDDPNEQAVREAAP